MKLISWNVNGYRAVMKKGFKEAFDNLNADIFCLQEIKMKENQMTDEMNIEGYHRYSYSANKAGYSGTLVYTKVEPIGVSFGIGIDEHDTEGRVITCEYEDFFLVNVYTPNSKQKLERLDYRMVWEDEFHNYLNILRDKKPVIVCGDLNVAHNEIDLKNPQSNRRSAGFTDEERNKMSLLLNDGYIDTFRYFYPDKTDEYSYWSYFAKARERNAGWRIDYFIVSDDLKDNLVDAKIHQSIMGSDHCPVELEINF
ncbi:exodeoxyribonuclease III [Finegoldia magna]|uniref:exodeoxyribonuclease III n=1 Tax=Finegoldia magna TaxID=1260 RepID=UPI001D15757E|nr:exodeoxyribonuclease III [Finegoldia magna]UEB32780.1 exodeoxyribonuclease III [Finegoldia magna]